MARLATLAADGAAHLVPVTFALDRGGERFLTAVDWKPKRTRELRRLADIRADPRVTILVDHYDDDWSKLWWVRMEGAARVVGAGTDFDDAIAALVAKYAPYRRRPPEGPAIVVDVQRWRWWSAAGHAPG